MSERHVFLFDELPVAEAQLRGGEGKGICRNILNESNATPGCVFNKMMINILNPGVSVGLHRHSGDAEIYIIISGSGLYTGKDGRKVKVKAGDVTICYSGEEHSLLNDSNEPLMMAGIIG